jgi:hypothetical protein
MVFGVIIADGGQIEIVVGEWAFAENDLSRILHATKCWFPKAKGA